MGQVYKHLKLKQNVENKGCCLTEKLAFYAFIPADSQTYYYYHAKTTDWGTNPRIRSASYYPQGCIKRRPKGKRRFWILISTLGLRTDRGVNQWCT
jgi:hypothetical protein